MSVVPVVCDELRAFFYWDYVAEVVLSLHCDVVCEEAVVPDEGFEAVAPTSYFLGSLNIRRNLPN